MFEGNGFYTLTRYLVAIDQGQQLANFSHGESEFAAAADKQEPLYHLPGV